MTLRRGSTGPEVEALQLWLVGQGLLTLVDGSFGPLTEGAVKAMQIRCQLAADGLVGDKTRLAFARAGWITSTQGQPLAPPAPFAPLNAAARQRIWGEIVGVAQDDRSTIKIVNGWAKANLCQVTIPQLVGIPGAPKEGVLLWHKRAARSLQALFEDIEREGLLSHILTFDGAWAPRFVRGSVVTLSAHAHATAIDLNAKWNPLGATPARANTTGSLVEIVPIAHRHGYYWGGHFSRQDGHHLEATRPDDDN